MHQYRPSPRGRQAPGHGARPSAGWEQGRSIGLICAGGGGKETGVRIKMTDQTQHVCDAATALLTGLAVRNLHETIEEGGTVERKQLPERRVRHPVNVTFNGAHHNFHHPPPPSRVADRLIPNKTELAATPPPSGLCGIPPLGYYHTPDHSVHARGPGLARGRWPARRPPPRGCTSPGARGTATGS